MGLLAPLFLVGALAAAIPIVLHLLKREPETRVRFAAVRLLRRAPVEHADRRHLRELLLLALRVAAVLLLALAFARPFFSAGAQAGAARATVVALDTSLSVSAPGQFDRARELARAVVDRTAGGDLVAVIAFDDAAEVLVRPTTDRAMVRTAIDRAVPGAGATRYRGALSAAVELLAGAPGTIVVVTDLQASGWDEGDRVALPASVNLEVADVGAPPSNLAVTAFHAEGNRLVAAVRNLGDAARDTTLTLSMHDTATRQRPRRPRAPARRQSAPATRCASRLRGSPGRWRRCRSTTRPARRRTIPGSWCSMTRAGPRCSWSPPPVISRARLFTCSRPCRLVADLQATSWRPQERRPAHSPRPRGSSLSWP